MLYHDDFYVSSLHVISDLGGSGKHPSITYIYFWYNTFSHHLMSYVSWNENEAMIQNISVEIIEPKHTLDLKFRNLGSG